MNDVVVTHVTTDINGNVITEVFRIEFQSDEDFERWLTTEYSLNVEKLTAGSIFTKNGLL